MNDKTLVYPVCLNVVGAIMAIDDFLQFALRRQGAPVILPGARAAGLARCRLLTAL